MYIRIPPSCVGCIIRVIPCDITAAIFAGPANLWELCWSRELKLAVALFAVTLQYNYSNEKRKEEIATQPRFP